jgi:2-amino-4-hydroxy-6-hydroxymethyldihydropteridine diphosphokinase
MKKNITEDLTLFFTNNYPYKSSKKFHKKYTVTLGIGGNIGDVKICFDLLFAMLQKDSRVNIIQTAPILKNPPFGYENQDDFLNTIIEINTNLAPLYILQLCWQYEKRFKRKRSFKDAPRTLDIDIIFIKNKTQNISIKTKNLIVPHIGYKHRPSVLIPLKYLK